MEEVSGLGQISKQQGAGYSEARNAIKGVVFTLYEMTTRDKARRDKRHEDQDISAVEQMVWSKHPDVRLDHPVHEFRRTLNDWRQRRRKGDQIMVTTQAPNALDWPPIPDPPLTQVTTCRGVELEPVEEFQKLADDLVKVG
ncbi:hypothetical protein IF1G_07040 [Cordyceps javanica]|uniref:Uncharacterized protein n=1 Tax=Cordyceps javanica TaxID=43265 RepID=A0A545UXH3_9HYPO|nr:hypothetical protein IF1G_07040 [Cordyceps javanica]TQW06036.1 hypothetical protein IF2G_06319 [Cordyceps javanica]